MKLRNKKTGEIAEIILNLNESLSDAIRRTIEEAGWEGVKKELRLEDENQRKAIKAWAKANDIAKFRVYAKTYYGWYCRVFSEGEPLIDICFVGKMPECFEDGEEYAIEELNEEWEGYEPAEPLIKDPKIRKAIRAWAEANDIDRVWHECATSWLRGNGLDIYFEGLELEQGNYTIAELCGEEEE